MPISRNSANKLSKKNHTKIRIPAIIISLNKNNGWYLICERLEMISRATNKDARLPTKEAIKEPKSICKNA
jgi:hypothetical protein